MENLNHLIVVFTAYVIAAGSPGPSTLRIMGVAAYTCSTSRCARPEAR